MKIYHNPRCRKSRETLQIIRSAGIEPEIIEYLKNPPSAKDLKEVLAMLKMRPEDIIRKNEDLYKQKFKDNKYTEDEWIDILVKNPKLIERPIVIVDDRAVLGRPPENVQSLL
jgi:arsenate reductase